MASRALLVLLGCLVLCLSLARGDGGGNNNFMTLRADCSDPYRVVVTLRTSEPFEGLLYSRNHASTCGVAGVGASNPVTTLVMDPERCGVEFSENGGGGGPVRKVDVYVQHDSFVQQVIDEQFQ